MSKHESSLYDVMGVVKIFVIQYLSLGNKNLDDKSGIECQKLCDIIYGRTPKCKLG